MELEGEGFDFSPVGLDAAERRLDEWERGFKERAEKTQALAAGLRDLTASMAGAGGRVEVTVSSSGSLTGLWLDESVRQQSAAWIARQVLATAREAVAGLVVAAGAVVEETVGGDSADGRAVLEAFAARLGRGSDGA
jgi:hypothetical protein